MAVQRNICFSYLCKCLFTEIDVNINFINGQKQLFIYQWKTCTKCVVEVNKHLLFKWNEGAFFSEEWDILYIAIKFYFLEKEVHSTVINLLHWALLVQTSNWIKHDLHLSSKQCYEVKLIGQGWTVTIVSWYIVDPYLYRGWTWSPVNVCKERPGVCVLTPSKNLQNVVTLFLAQLRSLIWW